MKEKLSFCLLIVVLSLSSLVNCLHAQQIQFKIVDTFKSLDTSLDLKLLKRGNNYYYLMNEAMMQQAATKLFENERRTVREREAKYRLDLLMLEYERSEFELKYFKEENVRLTERNLILESTVSLLQNKVEISEASKPGFFARLFSDIEKMMGGFAIGVVVAAIFLWPK